VLLAAAAADGCSKGSTGGITASGVFEAIEVNVGVKMPGQLKSVNFEEGQQIRAGDMLAEVDCADLVFQIETAKANLSGAKSQHELVVKGARKEDINQAALGEVQASAGYDLAKADYERIKKLYESNAVPKKMMDDADTRLKVSEAQKDSTAELVRKVKKYSRVEEIAMARSRVEAAQSTLDLAEKKLRDCRVIAPSDGWVLKKVFEAGEMVGPSSVVAVTSDLRKLRAVVYLPEADVFRIKLGDKARITTDGSPGRTFEGTVSFISQKAEFTPKNVQTKDERVKQMFAVKLLADNPDLVLKPGLPMDVEFPRNGR
jgi:HlyD family secretion protein